MLLDAIKTKAHLTNRAKKMMIRNKTLEVHKEKELQTHNHEGRMLMMMMMKAMVRDREEVTSAPRGLDRKERVRATWYGEDDDTFCDMLCCDVLF